MREPSVDLRPLSPPDATRRRVIRGALRAIEEGEAAAPPRWYNALEVPARHARWLVPAAVAVWALLWLVSAPRTPAPQEVDPAPDVYAAAWGVDLQLEAIPTSAVGVLARFAERAP